MNDEKRMRFENDQFYMKTEEEMREALKDFPEACDTTVEVAEKVDVVLERDSILPRFPLPEGETEESYFRRRVQEGLVKHYGSPVPQEAQERADYEMGIIIQQGFPAYFLIVQEYIEWARSQGIGVGPGRGSAAGAIVAYAMDITALDPLSNGLLFERFLSPERVEMPDIDVDFEQGRREEVINHIKDVYGEDHVSQVITFGTLQAKNAVRDAARVLDYPYNTGDRICKLIGDELGITIDKALATNPDLKKAYETEEDVKAVIDAAKSIEGHVRGEGVHACATIICRDPMADHVPMKRDTKGGGIITQYDGHYTPELGLLKMDFLGLRTLDVLTIACRNIEQRFGTKVVPEEIPIDDEAAFKLMQSGNMDGLFQVEGALYVSLFARLPSHALLRHRRLHRAQPSGPAGVRHGGRLREGGQRQDAIHYYDERLRPILEETYGTMVYQEQIMQISMAMSGFSAGKADKLRKAMGKKKLDVMRALQEDWNNGAVENGFSLAIAKQIWEDAEKFAKYAFNKSHSAAYAILVMRTAYLKAHYPNDFMAAVLSSTWATPTA
ncbi:MAG: DNA polymerase III subunit alpha [Gordonibacter pamelaeae]